MAMTGDNSGELNPNDVRSKRIIVSYRLMRRIVGILGLTIGILLPIFAAVLSPPCSVIQQSISHYYYTIVGDVFVGLLCAVAFFLILYPGDKGGWEDIWTNIAGVCALGVAFFPTTYTQLNEVCTKFSYEYEPWVGKVHIYSAGAFFIILAGVAFFQFPKTVATNEDAKKRRKRNQFYRWCGGIMWGCVAVLIPMFNEDYYYMLAERKIIFIAEVIALVAFGSCWLIKGIVIQNEIHEK